MLENLGKTSEDSPVTFEQITKEIEYCNAKIRDNCNVIGQLKKEDKALRDTVKLLKRKRTELAFSSLNNSVDSKCSTEK